jgi:hypothetical protein
MKVTISMNACLTHRRIHQNRNNCSYSSSFSRVRAVHPRSIKGVLRITRFPALQGHRYRFTGVLQQAIHELFLYCDVLKSISTPVPHSDDVVLREARK